MPQSGYSVRKFDSIGDAVDFLEDNEIVYLNLSSDGGSHFLFYRPLEVLTRLNNVAVPDALTEIMPLEFFGRFDMLRITVHNTDTGATGNAIDQVVIEYTYDDDILVVPVAEYLQVGGEGDTIAANEMKTYMVPGGFAFLRIMLGGAAGVTTASISVAASSAFAEAGGGGSTVVQSSPVGNAPAVTNATGAVAIATSTTVAAHFRLLAVTCHFDAAPTASENFTVTLNANDGAAYDTVLFSVDPSATSSTDLVYIPDGDLIFESGDEIDVAFANTDTVTYGLRIVTKVIA